MTRPILYLTAALVLSLTTNAWLIGFNAQHMEDRARQYTITKLETAAMSLRKNPIQAADDSTLPPVLRVSDLQRLTEYDNSKADAIAQILEGN